jgi:hypothetical protein
VLGFPIRKFPDQSLLTALRDLSQSSTSFIGNIRLGIHCVPLSTFLCIDLTSNWKIPITCRQSYFLTNQIVKFPAISPLENTFPRKPRFTPRLYSSFLILSLRVATCKVKCVVFFAIKKPLNDLLLYHISPEVLVNIRLTSNYYTRSRRDLQEIF